LLIAVYGLELLISHKTLRNKSLRLSLVIAISLIIAIVSCLIIIYLHNLVAILIAYFSLYRLVNLFRLLSKTQNFTAIIDHFKLTSIVLLFIQLALISTELAFSRILLSALTINYLLVILLLLFGLIFNLSILKHQQNMSKVKLDSNPLLTDYPTLTVAIPIRNETEGLNNCLLSVLACDYPKLEILVLDDQSTDKRTSDIIKSFAQSGVVFLAGKPVTKGWLAKNWAYQQLLEAANGELVLFCGADTIFDRQAISQLVSLMKLRKKQMISIIPKNRMEKRYLDRIMQPLRYAWEIGLPRRLIHRPPVLSTCWLSQTSFLKQVGGFSAIKKAVVCEAYFAKQSIDKDNYSFFLFDGVSSNKPTTDLLETAIRLRYPQLKKRLDVVALISLAELFIVFGAFYLFIFSIIYAQIGLLLVDILSLVLLTTAVAQVMAVTYRNKIYDNLYYWPIFVLFDLLIINWSMLKYDFSYVLWKGRRIDT